MINKLTLLTEVITMARKKTVKKSEKPTEPVDPNNQILVNVVTGSIRKIIYVKDGERQTVRVPATEDVQKVTGLRPTQPQSPPAPPAPEASDEEITVEAVEEPEPEEDWENLTLEEKIERLPQNEEEVTALLGGMKKAVLVAAGEKLGLDIPSNLKKSEIVDLIMEI